MKRKKGKRAPAKKAEAAPEAEEGFLQSHRRMFLLLLWGFSAFAVVFFTLPIGSLLWSVFALAGIAFFALEIKLNYAGKITERIRKAACIGLLVLALAFVSGLAAGALNLWKTSGSMLEIAGMPAEVLLLAFFGGTAWALYVPKEKENAFILFDTALFSVFSTLFGYLLAYNGLVSFGAWNYALDFAASAALWLALHFARYWVFPE